MIAERERERERGRDQCAQMDLMHQNPPFARMLSTKKVAGEGIKYGFPKFPNVFTEASLIVADGRQVAAAWPFSAAYIMGVWLFSRMFGSIPFFQAHTSSCPNLQISQTDP
jgi:hypothetical protein